MLAVSTASPQSSGRRSLECEEYSRGLAIDAPPVRGDVIVDLEGAFVLPGLINAHDHLELNHYGPLKGRDRYDNASAWIDDMRPRLQKDAAIPANRARAHDADWTSTAIEELYCSSLQR